MKLFLTVFIVLIGIPVFAQNCSFTVTDPTTQQPITDFSFSVPVGSTQSQTFQITPTGTIDFTFGLQESGAFVLPPFSVSPTSQTASTPFNITLTFAPTQEGSFPETLQITGTQGQNFCSLTLFGTGIGLAGFTVSTATLDFGPVLLGNSVTKPITITPSSQQSFTVASASIDASFTFLPTDATFQTAAAKTILITFKPASPGPKQATIAIVNGTNVEHDVSVTGTGTPPVNFTVSPSTLNFGYAKVGQSVTQTLTITPTPATSLNFTIKTPPDFSVVGGSTFTAQQPVTVTIQFTPDSPGSKGGTATISAQNGGGSMSLSVLGAGYYDTAIPHSVSGGGFLSRLFVVNLSQSSNNVIIERYTQAGTMVQTQQEKLAPQASLAIADSEATRSTALTIQWLRIYSEHPVTASVVFDELTGQSPTIMGTLSSPALTTFSAPVLYGTGFNGGIAVSDLSGTANVLTINLLDAIGTLKASRVLPLPGNGQLAEVVDDSQLFHDFLTSQGITVQSNSHFTGALSVQSTGPVAALMVGSENRQLFSLPVTPLVFAAAQQLLPNGFIAASNYQTVIPHSVAGGGFITRVLVNNLANAANAIAIYRFSQNGSLVNQTQQTIAPGGSYLLAGDQSERSLPSAAITWFAIASDQQVSASVLFDDEFQNTGSAVGSLSSAALTNFSVPLQITAAGATVGVALVNLSGSSSLVALTLVDSNGTALASNTLSLPAYNQTAFPLTTANQIPAIKNALCPAGVCQDFAGSLVVTTSPRQPVAALVLGFDGGHFYSLPVTQTPGL